MDHLTKEKRSLNMAKIKSRHTNPEIKVRKVLSGLGYRYRLYSNKLPGKPDIYIPKINTIFFVNGCFWHQHPKCKRATNPKTNTEYWNKKLEKNITKQRGVIQELTNINKRVVIIWECQTKDKLGLSEIIKREINEKENI